MPSETNPYASPTADSVPAETRRPNGSLAISIVSGLAALAFIVFTIVLLRSTAGDRKAGMIFLVNVPVLIAVSLFALLSKRAAMYLALAAAGVQAGIIVAMLVMGIGDEEVVIGINAVIIVPCLALAIWAWIASRLHRYENSQAEIGDAMHPSRGPRGS